MISANRIFLSVPYGEKDVAKTIVGARWHPGPRQWSFPLSTKASVMHKFSWAAQRIKVAYEEYQRGYDEAMERRAELEQQVADDMKPFSLNDELKEVKIPVFEFKIKPYAHQLKMLKCGLKWKKFAFFCEMGTGKSKVIIDLIDCINTGPVLIVCPKSVIYSWEKEIIGNLGIDINSESKYNFCVGSKVQKVKSLHEATENNLISIINYEGILSIGENPLWTKFKMVVLDESHKIKNHQAKRTKLIVKIFAKTEYKYILSGTPITQGPIDIYSQYKFLSPQLLGNTSFYSFRNTYCDMGGYGGYQIIRYKNLPALKATISRYSIQIKKNECLDLPDKVFSTMSIDMPPVLKKQYAEMKEEMVIDIGADEPITAQIILTKMLRLQQITSGLYIDPKYNEKLRVFEEFITEQVAAGESVVVWCKFLESIKLLSKTLEDKKISYDTIYGAVSAEHRKEIIEDFQEGRTKVLIGQESAGGIGITLTKSHTMVYYENTFSLSDRKQSEDRIHRIGQKQKCYYLDIIYKGSIDEHILKAIKTKQEVSTFLVDSFRKGDYTFGKKQGATHGKQTTEA